MVHSLFLLVLNLGKTFRNKVSQKYITFSKNTIFICTSKQFILYAISSYSIILYMYHKKLLIDYGPGLHIRVGFDKNSRMFLCLHKKTYVVPSLEPHH